MRKNFNASTAPGSIAIAGLSEGGLCATTLALNNPKEYVAFGNYSGDASPTYQYADQQQTIQTLFGGSQASYDAHNPPYMLSGQRFPGLSGWFEAGAQDPRRCRPRTQLQPLAAKRRDRHLHRHPAGRPRILLLAAVLLRLAALAVLEAEAHPAAPVRSCPVQRREELAGPP